MRDESGPEPVVIAGAGIAGLSAAIALKMAGCPVTVFERERAPPLVGAGIQLGPNATRIMENWSLDLLGESYEPESIELRSAVSGGLLNAIPLRRAVRARYGAPYITLMRAGLQKSLLNRASELDIPIAYGVPVRNVHAGETCVEIEAGDGVVQAPAFIGADGVHSALGPLIGQRPERYAAHAVAWRAMMPLSAVPAPMRSVIAVWMASGMHLVHYPVSGGAQVNAVLIIDGVYREDGEVSGQTSLPYLMARTEGWAEVPRSIVGAAGDWLPWRMYGVQKWAGGSGRVQFIGDAWHPMRPHLASGAVMAIEDASSLADNLSSSPGSVPEALRRFRAERSGRVWRVVENSALMGRIYHFPPPFDLIRNLFIRTATGSMLLSQNDWLYGIQREGRPYTNGHKF